MIFRAISTKVGAFYLRGLFGTESLHEIDISSVTGRSEEQVSGGSWFWAQGGLEPKKHKGPPLCLFSKFSQTPKQKGPPLCYFLDFPDFGGGSLVLRPDFGGGSSPKSLYDEAPLHPLFVYYALGISL